MKKSALEKKRTHSSFEKEEGGLQNPEEAFRHQSHFLRCEWGVISVVVGSMGREPGF